MVRRRKLKYCRAIIICHGKSEKLLFDKIKSVLRIKIAVRGNDNGNSSIKIQGIANYLQRQEYQHKKDFCNTFFGTDCRDVLTSKQLNSMIQKVKIFVVMDVDDASKDQLERYKKGEFFYPKWLKPCFVPIYNDPNLEQTVKKMGYEIPSSKNDKAPFYRKLWADNITTVDDVKILEQKMKCCKCTNMEQVLDFLLKSK